MNNVKLTLATTLSVLALTFVGSASADNGNRYKNHKQNDVTSKTTINKHGNRNVTKTVTRKSYNNRGKNVATKNRVVTRTVVKHSPKKTATFSRTIIKKPAKQRYVSNNKFKQVKHNNQRARYNNRAIFNNSYTFVNGKRIAKRFAYSVRPGDTLIRISLKTGVSVKRLARLNRLNQRHINFLKVGQVLRLA